MNNDWLNIGLSINDGTRKLYLNGKEISSEPFGSEQYASQGQMWVNKNDMLLINKHLDKEEKKADS